MLKKLAAILLTGVLLFNWYGYRLLIAYWQWRSDHVLENRLNNDDYDESELMFIKFPAPYLPYSNESTEFERVDGEIILGDIAYKFIKRRLFRDSIELLCIRNTALTRMSQARDEFFRQTNNLNHFPNSKPVAGNDFQKVYSPATLCFQFRSPDPIGVRLTEFLIPSLQPGHDRQAERPPNPRAIL
ncbi:MAG: hypothetical protein P4L51_15750 [Puia sp.]|nr:hypothetical protein [Puia sp.]